MKKIFVILALLASINVAAAPKLVSKTGHVWFYSHTPVEDIEAHNRQSVSILNTETGEIQISILIKSFEFKVALMQEHFNENYMESSKFPKSSFKGNIVHLDKVDFTKDGTYTSDVAGDLTIHGVVKKVTTSGTFEVKDGKVTAKAKFIVSPKDYEIVIPSLVESKIAKEIEITVELPYTE